MKVQVDLTKDRPDHVWFEYTEVENGEGRWQNIQYEDVPDYCNYCKHQGHSLMTCTLKIKNNEVKTRKKSDQVGKNVEIQQVITDSSDVHKTKPEKLVPLK